MTKTEILPPNLKTNAIMAKIEVVPPNLKVNDKNRGSATQLKSRWSRWWKVKGFSFIKIRRERSCISELCKRGRKCIQRRIDSRPQSQLRRGSCLHSVACNWPTFYWLICCTHQLYWIHQLHHLHWIHHCNCHILVWTIAKPPPRTNFANKINQTHTSQSSSSWSAFLQPLHCEIRW